VARVYHPEDPAGAELAPHALDEFALVASWFRRKPEERAHAVPPTTLWTAEPAAASGSETQPWRFAAWSQGFSLVFETLVRTRELSVTSATHLVVAVGGLVLEADLELLPRHGSLFDFEFRLPAEWNVQEVTVKGSTIKVVLNGETIIDNAQLPGIAAEGPIALQYHHDAIEFANVFIKEL
jgi:hypothetical protein